MPEIHINRADSLGTTLEQGLIVPSRGHVITLNCCVIRIKEAYGENTFSVDMINRIRKLPEKCFEIWLSNPGFLSVDR